MTSIAALLAVGVFILGMLYAIVGDITTMTIKNALVIFLVTIYFILAPWAGVSQEAIAHGILTALAVLAVGSVLFFCHWVGGGDVKLAAATALWLGAESTPSYIVYSALFGGILTVILLSIRGLKLPARLEASAWISRLHNRRTGIPYGVALGLAALAVLPTTRWLSLL